MSTLGEICSKITDGSHNPPKGIPASDFMMLSSKNILDDQITLDAPRYLRDADFINENKRTGIQPGDVLLTIVGTVGRSAVVPSNLKNITLQRSVAVLRPRPQIVNSRFLMFALQHRVEALQAQSQGVAQKGLYLAALKVLQFALPPLEEQRRIVAVLDEAFAAIATATAYAEKNFANARELFKSELTSVIDAGGEGWRDLPLGAFCEMYQPQTIGRADMVEGGPYPVFGANGIIGRYHQFNHAEPQLLVTCRGATCGSLNLSAPNSWITGNAMVVRPKDGVLRLKLLMRIFEGAFDFSKVITGAAQPQITRQSFAPARVKFPSKPDEQDRLEVRFDNLQAYTNALADVYLAKQSALSRLKQSLLQKAFHGPLTETATETIAA